MRQGIRYWKGSRRKRERPGKACGLIRSRCPCRGSRVTAGTKLSEAGIARPAIFYAGSSMGGRSPDQRTSVETLTGCDIRSADRDGGGARLDTGGRRVMPWRSGGLVEVRWSLVLRFSRPFMQTVRILTGPHSQLRYCHFAAGDRPAHERCGVLAMTFWAAHTPLSHTLRGNGTRKSPRELDRSRPNRRSSLLLNVCHVGRLHGVYIREELIHVSIILLHDGLPSRLVIGAA